MAKSRRTQGRQREFNDLLASVKSKEFPYEPRKKKTINWPEYDMAQTNEVCDMLVMIRDTVERAAHDLHIPATIRSSEQGRPRGHPMDLAKAVLVQQYFSASNRAMCGLTTLFNGRLGISRDVSYKAIERAYEEPIVIMILQNVFSLTHEPVSDKEVDFAGDGTGIPTSRKNNRENDKRLQGLTKGKKETSTGGDEAGTGEDDVKRPRYEKMVLLAGVKYKLISSVVFPDNPHANEAPFFKQLLEETLKFYARIGIISLDSAYLSREICNAIGEAGGTPRIFPKEGITLKKKGSREWAEQLLDFMNDPQEWLREYHPRSISETVNSVYKGDMPIPLRRDISVRRKAEAFTRVCVYNLKRLCYLRYLEGIEVPWLSPA